MEILRRPSETGVGPPGYSGDFKMTEEDLRRITLRGQTAFGIELGEGKRQMIHSRLSRRLRALGMSRFSDYLDFLDTPEGASEHEMFANALTTNLTAFFRESHHFDHFEQEIQATARQPRRLRIWSAGCSTGEEPYSIAMILQAHSDKLGSRDRRILATDLDTGVLETASRGVYGVDRLKGMPQRFRGPAYLGAAGPEGQAVSEALRSLVVFRKLNLIRPWPFKGPFDIIFCRNVLIYFSVEMRGKLIDRFTELLHPRGLLYLGHSESILGTHPKLAPEGHTIYRRASQ